MERLQKVIAHAGVASRRKAEQLIIDGKVKVNGKTVTELGVKVSKKDEIIVNGKMIQKEELVYYVLNKPMGYLSTSSDDRGRDCVVDLLPKTQRLYPVGRLDYDTTGVLIMTNDGEFTNLMTHPSYGIEKEYVAIVRGIVTKANIKELEKGVMVDGKITSRAKARLVGTDKVKKVSKVHLIIHEGRYHQVKRMFEAIGFRVMKLNRIRYGNVTVDNVQLGEYRRLKIHEYKVLINMAKRKGV